MRPATASLTARALAALAILFTLAATPSSATAACGDFVVDGNEQCDDGNTQSGDCCDADCTLDPSGAPCNDDGLQCTTDSCNGEGTCNHIPLTGPCDDGNPCTLGEFCGRTGQCIPQGIQENGVECPDANLCGGFGACLDGVCGGDPADCSGIGFECQVAVCDPDKRACQVSPAANGTPCGQPGICTEGGECDSGECIPRPKDCSAFADDCNVALCDVEIPGGCFASPKQDGTACEDGNGCSVNDSCKAGLCESGSPRDCSAFDDACHVGVCNGDLGECQAVLRENGSECSDGDPCTNFDTCTNGECAGTPLNCSEFSSQCFAGTCNPQTGGCEAVPTTGPCDDGNSCTTGDTCSDGECLGNPLDCSDLDGTCASGFCNPDSGKCEASPFEDGASCDDGNACTLRDQCTGGACGGTPVVCSGGIDGCQQDTCNPQTGQCAFQPRPDGAACDDGDACTLRDQCSAGQCTGTPADCSAFDTACTTGSCSSNGDCVAEPRPNGTACSDGNGCTTGDQCVGGQCSGAPVDCSGSNGPCAVGACNPDTGQCAATPVGDGTACNDGNACTLRDQCTAGACAGTPVVCNGGISGCQEFRCEPQSGECALLPRQDGVSCDDGNGCTTGDQCSAGQCTGTPADCSQLDTACTVGSCSVGAGGCVATPRNEGGECSDGNACTSGDTCTAGSCAGTPLDCSVLDGACRTGRCNPQVGQCEAVAAGDGTPCDDQAFCTLLDQCIGGACTGTGNPCAGGAECASTCNEAADSCLKAEGTPCSSDGNPCTDDACDGDGGCAHTANTDACDDGLYCTTGDTCVDGECSGEPTCPQTDGCGDTCNEAEDACRTCGHPFSEERCVVNAIFVLQAAVGLRDCELCTCDVDDSGAINTSDALRILRTCVDLPVTLVCPEPNLSTTTTSTTVPVSLP